MKATSKPRPEGSNWGDYGPNDKLGRLNELTDARVLRAAAEIRTGKRFCLSLPLHFPGGTKVANPTRHPPVRHVVDRRGRPAEDYPLDRDREGALGFMNDEYTILYNQYSTQWDGFGHVGSSFDADGDGKAEVLYYNGHYPATAADVEGMAVMGFQGRGVMIDLHQKYGNNKIPVTYAMLAEVMREQGVTVEPGDILALHTGIGQLILEAAGDPGPHTRESGAGLDGCDPDLLAWVAASGIVAIVADNPAVEIVPALWRDGPTFGVPLHELCLFRLGIHLAEFLYLTELANWLRENGRYRFFLTAPPLRLRGHVGSPMTPIATV